MNNAATRLIGDGVWLRLIDWIASELFRIAQILSLNGASAAVFAEMRCWLDELFERFGIRFDKPLLLKGAQCFFFVVAHG
jgi:hypothetical protein